MGEALVNGDWTSFDPHTVRLMIRMFDTDGDGTIGFDEFWYDMSSPKGNRRLVVRAHS